MAEVKTIRFVVKGGEIRPGGALAPTLSSLRLPVGKVVAEMNKATSKWKGVPCIVVLEVIPAERKFKVISAKPTTAGLLMLKAKKNKGSGKAGHESAADLKFKDVVEVAREKLPDLNVKSLKAAIKCVLGTMVSMGFTVEGHHPKEVQKNIDEWMKKCNIKDEPVY